MGDIFEHTLTWVPLKTKTNTFQAYSWNITVKGFSAEIRVWLHHFEWWSKGKHFPHHVGGKSNGNITLCVSVCVWGHVTSAFKRNVTVRGCSFEIRRIMVSIVYFFYVQYDQSDFTNMPGAEATPLRSPSFSRKSPGFEILLTTKSTAKCTWSIKSRSTHDVKCLTTVYDRIINVFVFRCCGDDHFQPSHQEKMIRCRFFTMSRCTSQISAPRIHLVTVVWSVYTQNGDTIRSVFFFFSFFFFFMICKNNHLLGIWWRLAGFFRKKHFTILFNSRSDSWVS